MGLFRFPIFDDFEITLLLYDTQNIILQQE